MYNLLKGKRGIIFGALDSKSIAWKVAERAHEEGAKFVLTNAPVALRLGTISELAEKTGSQVIASDATSMMDLEELVTKSMEILGYIILLKLVIAYCIANYKYILKTEKDLFIQLKIVVPQLVLQ